MFWRERLETEYHPLFKAPYNYGTTIWSPLASGMLTGKYNDGIPAGSRLASPSYKWLAVRLESWKKEGKIHKIRELTNIAEKELGCSMSQLAIAWCLKVVVMCSISYIAKISNIGGVFTYYTCSTYLGFFILPRLVTLYSLSLSLSGFCRAFTKHIIYMRAHSRPNCGVSCPMFSVQNPNVSTVLLGASKPEQLQENIKAVMIPQPYANTHALPVIMLRRLVVTE